MMYAALEWCTQNYTMFIDQLRELSGGSVFQLPADISVLADPHLAEQFRTYFQTPQADAVSRMKLFKLAWDMVGSEFAGRHCSMRSFTLERRLSSVDMPIARRRGRSSTGSSMT